MMVTPEPAKPDPNTYWVVPGKLLAGEYPGAPDSEEARRRLRRFLAAGVRHFIDLTEVAELEPYAELVMEEASSRTTYERFPIRGWECAGRTENHGRHYESRLESSKTAPPMRVLTGGTSYKSRRAERFQ